MAATRHEVTGSHHGQVGTVHDRGGRGVRARAQGDGENGENGENERTMVLHDSS
jgi:hypothetical protein